MTAYHRQIAAAVMLVVLAGLSATAIGQDAAVDAAGPDEQPTKAPATMPPIGDLLALAEKATAPAVGGDDVRGDWSAPVKLAVVFTMLALLPSLLVMMTAFTRIVIVLSFIRRALTTQAIPPNIALVGLALFLTIFTMSPTLAKINEQSIQPYLQDELTFSDAVQKGNDLLKEFMLRQTRSKDLELFVELGGIEPPSSPADVPTHVAIPSFAISEFRTAFEMGFKLFIPFLLVDLVVAGILLSAGMMMLPPVIVSLPFKIILFVLVDGWRLVAEALVTGFY